MTPRGLFCLTTQKKYLELKPESHFCPHYHSQMSLLFSNVNTTCFQSFNCLVFSGAIFLLSLFFLSFFLSFLLFLTILATVQRDAQARWGLTLNNCHNKGSFLFCHSEAHHCAPSARPSQVYQQQFQWGLSDGNLLLAFLWHTECSLFPDTCLHCCSPWLPLHFRSPRQLKNCSSRQLAGWLTYWCLKWRAHVF